MKAFANSMLAITASLLLLEILFSLQAFSLRSVADSRESFSIGYSGYYFDDVSYDLRKIMNPSNLSITRHNSTSFRIAFTLVNESLATNFTSQSYSINNSLVEYDSMLSSFESKANINISLNYTNLTSGNFTLPLSEGLNFTYTSGNPDSVTLETSSLSSLTNITINIVSPYPSTSFSSPSIPQGGWQDMWVELNYQDPVRTYKDSGYLHKNQFEHMYVEYGSGNSTGLLEVTFGSTGKNESLLYITRQNVFPSVEVVAYANVNSTSLDLEYPIEVSVSYLNVSKSDSGIKVFTG